MIYVQHRNKFMILIYNFRANSNYMHSQIFIVRKLQLQIVVVKENDDLLLGLF